jgi:hypothetical protein
VTHKLTEAELDQRRAEIASIDAEVKRLGVRKRLLQGEILSGYLAAEGAQLPLLTGEPPQVATATPPPARVAQAPAVPPIDVRAALLAEVQAHPGISLAGLAAVVPGTPYMALGEHLDRLIEQGAIEERGQGYYPREPMPVLTPEVLGGVLGGSGSFTAGLLAERLKADAAAVHALLERMVEAGHADRVHSGAKQVEKLTYCAPDPYKRFLKLLHEHGSTGAPDLPVPFDSLLESLGPAWREATLRERLNQMEARKNVALQRDAAGQATWIKPPFPEPEPPKGKAKGHRDTKPQKVAEKAPSKPAKGPAKGKPSKASAKPAKPEKSAPPTTKEWTWGEAFDATLEQFGKAKKLSNSDIAERSGCPQSKINEVTYLLQNLGLLRVDAGVFSSAKDLPLNKERVHAQMGDLLSKKLTVNKLADKLRAPDRLVLAVLQEMEARGLAEREGEAWGIETADRRTAPAPAAPAKGETGKLPLDASLDAALVHAVESALLGAPCAAWGLTLADLALATKAPLLLVRKALDQLGAEECDDRWRLKPKGAPPSMLAYFGAADLLVNLKPNESDPRRALMERMRTSADLRIGDPERPHGEAPRVTLADLLEDLGIDDSGDTETDDAVGLLRLLNEAVRAGFVNALEGPRYQARSAADRVCDALRGAPAEGRTVSEVMPLVGDRCPAGTYRSALDALEGHGRVVCLTPKVQAPERRRYALPPAATASEPAEVEVMEDGSEVPVAPSPSEAAATTATASGGPPTEASPPSPKAAETTTATAVEDPDAAARVKVLAELGAAVVPESATLIASKCSLPHSLVVRVLGQLKLDDKVYEVKGGWKLVQDPREARRKRAQAEAQAKAAKAAVGAP